MTIDKEKLKALAEAAQAWSGEIGEHRWYEAECFKQPYFGLPDAEFLAAISPVTVLALLAEIEQLSGRVTTLEKYEDECLRLMRDAEAERDQLKAQVVTLQSDANSWQSGYDEGRRMGTKIALEERDQLKAELAGLRTGYDAQNEVIAGLRKDAAKWKSDSLSGSEDVYRLSCELAQRTGEVRELAGVVDDLSALTKQFVQRLRKGAPDSDLPEKAMDYLRRKGLQGSPLRAATSKGEQP